MSNIEGLINSINKKFKSQILVKGTDIKQIEFIPFSSPRMNYLLRGGIPKNKMVEFVGKEGSGKTTSALDIVAQFQKQEPQRLVMYVDAENTLDREWAIKLGVNFERLLLLQPTNETGEQILQIVIDAVKTGEIGLVVIDSVPFLVPASAWDADLEKKFYGGNSALMTEFCKRIIPLMTQYSTTVLMINQVREKIGTPYTAYVYTGGHMLYHACSTIIFFSKGSLLDAEGKEVSNSYESPQGHIIQAKVEKNKVTINDRKVGFYTLNYYKGIDIITDLVDVAIVEGIIQQAGSWFMFGDAKYQGRTKLVQALHEDKDLYNSLQNLVNDIIK